MKKSEALSQPISPKANKANKAQEVKWWEQAKVLLTQDSSAMEHYSETLHMPRSVIIFVCQPSSRKPFNGIKNGSISLSKQSVMTSKVEKNDRDNETQKEKEQKEKNLTSMRQRKRWFWIRITCTLIYSLKMVLLDELDMARWKIQDYGIIPREKNFAVPLYLVL